MAKRKGGGQTAKPTPMTERIRAWLDGKGWQTPRAIQEATGIARNTVTVCLVSLDRRGLLDHGEGIWRVKPAREFVYTGTLYDVLLPSTYTPRDMPCTTHYSQ